MTKHISAFILIMSLLLLSISGSHSATFTLHNNCDDTIWPGLMSNAGRSMPSTTGFQLEKGQSMSISPQPDWSGRIWARTRCTTDSAGKFSCATGDCGSGKVECSGSGATPPATLAEFTLGSNGATDFFDVSLVDGYNMPITVVAQGGSGTNCSSAGCGTDVNGLCPQELRVIAAEGTVLACRSACDAFGSAKYCCSGAYANPNTCIATSYSELFKKACPRAYSYAYDDGSSTFTCSGADGYLITFCPTASSSSPQTVANHPQPTSRHPGASMVYWGDDLMSSAITFSLTSNIIIPSLAFVLLITPTLLRLVECLL